MRDYPTYFWCIVLGMCFWFIRKLYLHIVPEALNSLFKHKLIKLAPADVCCGETYLRELPMRRARVYNILLVTDGNGTHAHIEPVFVLT